MEESIIEIDESLNIDAHIVPMVLKALNTSCCFKSAADKLGVSERTIYRMKYRYNIIKVNEKYVIKPNTIPHTNYIKFTP